MTDQATEKIDPTVIRAYIHDLNNAIGTVKGLGEAVKMADDLAEAQCFVKKIMEAAHIAEKATRDLSDHIGNDRSR